MMLAYVDGRPTPSSSRRRTSDASVKRAGGFVSCDLAVSSVEVERVVFSQGREAPLLVVEVGVRVVAAFHVGSEEPGELDDLAARRELCIFPVGR